jgi:Family of unknown function (DUF5681)
MFKKGQSGNPSGLPKNPPSPERRLEEQARREVYGEVSNIVVEARKYSGLAVDTLVDIARDGQTDNSRLSAAAELLNRGHGRPAQSLDLHLSADAITKRLSDMTDAELAALEARMITIPATLALEHADEPQADGGIDAGQDGDGCADDEGVDDEAAGNST